jgi:hypothetical protein
MTLQTENEAIIDRTYSNILYSRNCNSLDDKALFQLETWKSEVEMNVLDHLRSRDWSETTQNSLFLWRFLLVFFIDV